MSGTGHQSEIIYLLKITQFHLVIEIAGSKDNAMGKLIVYTRTWLDVVADLPCLLVPTFDHEDFVWIVIL